MKKSALLLVAGVYAAIATTPVMAMNGGEGHEGYGHHGGGIAGGGWMFRAEEIDTDQNGSISTEEMNTFHKKVFDTADTNKDGSLDTQEFQTMHDQKKAQYRDAKFKRMDTDGDGKLSLEETTRKKDRSMQRCDRDGNGELSKNELQACHTGMQERMQKQHGINTEGAPMNRPGDKSATP